MDEDREMEPPIKSLRVTPPIIENSEILKTKICNLEQGELVSILTPEKKVHGFVEKTGSKTLRILEFIAEEATLEAPDVNIKTYHFDEIQEIHKVPDPERFMTPAREMDLLWVFDNIKYRSKASSLYSTYSRTVTFFDFLKIFEKIHLKTLLNRKYSRTVTLFCNSPGVSTVIWVLN